MNKAKKKIAVLKTYLDKDSQGCKLLSEVTDEVNALRKQVNEANTEISALKQHASRCEAKQAEADGRAADERRAFRQLQTQFDPLTDENKRLHREVKRLEGRVRELEPTELSGDSSRFNNQDAFMVALSRIGLRECPASVARDTYLIEQVARDYSIDEMAKLGSFVAVMAAVGMPPKMRFDEPKNILKGVRQGLSKSFVRWFMANNVAPAGPLVLNLRDGA